MHYVDLQRSFDRKNRKDSEEKMFSQVEWIVDSLNYERGSLHINICIFIVDSRVFPHLCVTATNLRD